MARSKTVYVKSDNGSHIIILEAELKSMRCRMRNRDMNNEKIKLKPMNLASYKEMMKYQKRDNTTVCGPYKFYSMSRL